MAGRPDPAFLDNVPGAIDSISSSSGTSYPISLSISSINIATKSSSTTSSSAISSSITSVKSTGSTIVIPGGSSSSSNSFPSVYPYVPSTALAICFSTSYGALIPYHFYLSVYNPHIRRSVAQKHTYTIPLLVACILSTVGHSIRIISTTESHRASVGLYAISQACIVLAPIFVCATLYLLMTHLIDLCLPQGKDRTFLRMGPQWMGRIFIVSDVVSLLVQGAGNVIAASGRFQGSQRGTGLRIITVGLAAQLGTFTLYLVILALFCYRVGKGHETRQQEDPRQDQDQDQKRIGRDFGFNPLVKQVVKGVWIASILIEIRSIFRTIQFGLGSDAYPFKHEWTLWVCDAIPMWIALLVLGIYHPTKWLQSKRRSWFVEKNTRNTMQ